MKKLLITVCMAVTSMAVPRAAQTRLIASMALACSESSREDSIVE